VYEKWLKNGGVWSAAAREVNVNSHSQAVPWLTSALQTHLNQLGHVKKGCLARSREDVSSDGSRIEGSHKGWNALQRSFSSGIELITALSHDFVLRRNCRVASDSKHPREFNSSTHGSHHVRLVSAIATMWNSLLDKEKGKGGGEVLLPLPVLQEVRSDEEFGLVISDYTLSFQGLLAIKEEEDPLDGLLEILDDPENGDLDLALTADPALLDNTSTGDLISNIDPALLTIPRNSSTPILPSSSPAADSDLVIVGSSKRKTPCTDDPQAPVKDFTTAKKARVRSPSVVAVVSPQCDHKLGLLYSHSFIQTTNSTPVVTSATSNSEAAGTLETYFKDKRPIGTTALARPNQQPKALPTMPAADMFKLPVNPRFAGLTKSQRLFSFATSIDPRSLSISTDVEFFLFMEMRAERGWESYKMTSHKWVVETEEYNRRLTDRSNTGQQLIKKNPRALLEKLFVVKAKVTERLSTGNFKCQYSSRRLPSRH
jgi:hypothetical protein